MNHAKIYSFSDDLCPQWALRATSYQCLIHLAVRCTMCPHWAPGATRLQRPFYLAILDVPGPLWALGATTWTTSRSIHFWRYMSPMSPESPFIQMSYTSSRSMHYGCWLRVCLSYLVWQPRMQPATTASCIASERVAIPRNENNPVFLAWLHFYNPTLIVCVSIPYLSSHITSVV